MSEYVLVKAEYDYADEFDCCVMFCGLKSTFEELKSSIKKWFEDHDGSEKEIYIGTNENLTFDSYKDVFPDGEWRSVDILEISKDQYDVLVKFFADQIEDDEGNDIGYPEYFTWGTGSGVFDFDSWISEESESEEE